MLTVEQLFILALVVTGLVQVIKIGWIGILNKPKPSQSSLKLLVFVVSMPFGFLWAAPVLPGIPPLPPLSGEPVEIAAAVLAYAGAWVMFAGGLLAAAGAVFVVARLAYEYLLEGVLKGLDSAVLSKIPFWGKRAALAP